MRVVLACLKGICEDEMWVYYAIVVEAKKKIIWDCKEEYDRKTDLSAFDHCVGDFERLCGVPKLKRLDFRLSGNRDQRPRKMALEKKAERIATRRHKVAMI